MNYIFVWNELITIFIFSKFKLFNFQLKTDMLLLMCVIINQMITVTTTVCYIWDCTVTQPTMADCMEVTVSYSIAILPCS